MLLHFVGHLVSLLLTFSRLLLLVSVVLCHGLSLKKVLAVCDIVDK